jgi:uncharacterized protein
VPAGRGPVPGREAATPRPSPARPQARSPFRQSAGKKCTAGRATGADLGSRAPWHAHGFRTAVPLAAPIRLDASEPRAAPAPVEGAAATPSRGAVLAAYAVLTYAATALHTVVFAADVRFLGIATVAFVLAVHLTYSAMYAAAGLAPALVVDRVLALRPLRGMGARRIAVACVAALAVLGPAAVHFALFADGFLHRMYGFHLNGMVWNLVTTPGGIDSMDAGGSTRWAVVQIAVAFVALQAGILVAARRWVAVPRRVAAVGPRRWAALGAVFVALGGAERVSYGLADAASYRPVATAGGAYPFYQRSRCVGLARKLGIAADDDEERNSVDVDAVRLSYPLAPLRRRVGAKDLNVLWLVSESLRADALDAEVMPATTEFARGARRFLRHYSGGNGTRMGMFSMFYGLHGCSWFPFLAESRSPVVLDALIDAGYDVSATTSAKFTFPEFDKTIFARFPKDRLLEGDPALQGWQNDRAMVSRLLDDLDRRDRTRPFFRFHFFESPHARYLFPPESVIRPDFERTVNYVTMDLHDPEQGRRIRNRYLNACHHLDQQLARIFDHLRTSGLLDSTIVIVTGDHGEEFMEKGRWGHHSAFTEEQTRTPLVLRAPGVAPGESLDLSSHEDLPATLLALLGFENRPSDYSLGIDLLGGERRDHVVVADWENLAWFGADAKLVLPVRGMGWSGDTVATPDDAPVPSESAVRARHHADVAAVLREIGRFAR